MREELNVNRNHKDKLFRRLFDGNENKENLLSLYNAVNNTEYTDVSALEITTLEDAIYLGMKNDVSFMRRHNLRSKIQPCKAWGFLAGHLSSNLQANLD